MAGRKRIEIDYKQLDKLLGLQATLKECSSFFDCSEETIKNAIKRDFKMTFEEYRDTKKQKGLISLRRAQFQLAEKNAAMAIFLGKNYLGQKDSYEQKIKQQDNPFEDLSTDELRKLIDDE